MIYVGIDIAKLTHYASIMNSDGEILVAPFSFTNDHSGFQKLLSYLDSFPQNETFIGMESTAHYAENLTSFQSGIHGKACYTLLKEQPNPDRIAKMHLTRLTNLLSKSSHGHFKQSNAVRLKELASQSVGIKNSTLSLQILQSIKQIEMYTEQLAEVEASIQEIMNKIDSVIKTIPGIGSLNGAMIIGEVGDITRFEKPCQLLAYAGLDPSVYQSGNFTASRT